MLFIMKIYECNVVCLIFSENVNQIELQNSLFANKFTDLLTFTKLSKNKDEIIKFAEQLGNGSTWFYLNESTIPDFENLNCTLK